MHLTAIEIARAVHGDLVGADVDVSSVAIDSRELAAGSLFVPIVGDRDGHEFIADAVDAGAAAYLTAHRSAGGTAIEVADTHEALLDLGRHVRTRLPDKVVGITGSVGKTSVKDLTAAALRARFTTSASPRSFNNELGVPLTLANSPDDVDAVVVEMGARGRGHIALLCDIAHPTVGVVTAVALAHTELFGTVDDVAAAKGELVEALPQSGTAVLNGDQPLVAGMSSRTSARVITFGVERTGLEVTASDISVDDELRPSFHLHSPWGGGDIRLGVRGAHQVMNALAAAAAAMACGCTPDDVASGLAAAQLSPWRMDLRRAPSGALVLNDAYNANPASVEAALRSLAALPIAGGGRRIAVLGLMAELGPTGPDEHRRIAALAHDLGIEVIAVDAPDYGVRVVRRDELDLAGVREGDAVLVKGSRVAGLERVAQELLQS